MRILVCGINYAPDLIGVAKYNTELCEALSSLGHEVRVITAPPYYPAWQIPSGYGRWTYRSEMRHGVQVTRVPIYVPQKPNGLKRLLHHGSFALLSTPSLVKAALRWRPQLIFAVAPSLMSSALIPALARKIGAVSWLHLQDFEIDAAFGLGFLSSERLKDSMREIEHQIFCSFDRVSSIAPAMLQRLAEKGVLPIRIRELRNWTDVSSIVPAGRMTKLRAELGLDDSQVVALYSGSMSDKQGLELIIKAARQLKSTSPDISFILCGDGPRKTTLEAEAAQLRTVRFIELQPERRLAELLNTADIHLMPQRAEAADLVLPSKLGGILASGRPVIAMAAPETGLAKEIEGAGVLVPPGDAPALAAALHSLAAQPETRGVLGANARRRALERWDRSAIIGRIEAEFKDLCEKPEVVLETTRKPVIDERRGRLQAHLEGGKSLQGRG